MHKLRSYLFILLIAAISAMPAQGQSSKDTSGKILNEVIVTGQHKPQSVKNSVYQVRVINQERIRLSGATNVQQVLNNQLGFRFFNDNTLGVADVELMGMSGRNVKILLDGVPLADRGDTRESLNQTDISNIERIEIVEGPMSVAYGSDALAGVINLITKKPGKETLSVTARLQEETAGNEYYPFSYQGMHMQNLGLSWQKRGWNVAMGGTHNDFDGFGGNEWGREKTWRPKEQWLGNARLGYRNNNFGMYYRLDGLDEDIIARGKINFNTYKSIDQQFLTNRYMHQLQQEWRINEKLQLNSIVSYTDYKRETKTVRHDFTNGKEELTTGAGEQDIAKLNSFIFRPTLQYSVSSRVSLQTGIDINREAASGQRISGKPVITDYALFVSTEMKLGNWINIRPGLRFIKNAVYDAPPVIPSVNTKLSLSKTLDLRVAYAYGFRSPALRELYFSFHDANHDIEGNPNLKAEHSNSFNGSLSWTSPNKGDVQLVSALGGFYNLFNNQINTAQTAPNSTLYTYINIDRFKTTGGTWENKLSWKDLSATLGFSYIGRYNALSADKTHGSENLPGFVWAAEVNSNIIYTVKKIGTTFGLFYKFTGKRPAYQLAYNNSTGQDEVQLTKVASFNWADFTLTKPFLKYLTVTAGVKNIFDVTDLNSTAAGSGGAHSSSGPLPLSYGRSYFLGLGFQWKK
ncbi:MAG TPA: TonB-dependent receptor [Chitinophagaceae bacterium]|nr:TonB-dependent receptor [Chitinophagaceae bacterium]